MQVRIKWKKNTNGRALDQLVLIKDKNLPPIKWELGHVLSLTSGKDGISRVAVVKPADGLMSRAGVLS